MYPRVKVREQEVEDDQFEYEKRSLQSLKLPSNDFSSPDDSPTSVVRVPQFMDSSDQGAAHSRELKVLEENTTSIKASPVLRPRAVLSSRDNDQLVGSKSKTRKESLSSTKKDSSLPNRHTKCKVIPRPAAGTEAPVRTTRELKDVALRRNDLQNRQRSASADACTKMILPKQILKPLPVRVSSNLPTPKRQPFE